MAASDNWPVVVRSDGEMNADMDARAVGNIAAFDAAQECFRVT
jgi:hypothetical protein